MTTICLIRHGETEWNKLNKLQGRSDIPLNERGCAEAHDCGKYLKKDNWDAIITSPLLRAKQTAVEISSVLEMSSIEEHHDLVERDYGLASGLLPEERSTLFPDGLIPGIEAWEDLSERMMQAMASIAQKHENKKIIVVSHGAAINAVLATISNGDIGTGKTNLKNCSRNYLEFNDSEWKIIAVNKTTDEHE